MKERWCMWSSSMEKSYWWPHPLCWPPHIIQSANRKWNSWCSLCIELFRHSNLPLRSFTKLGTPSVSKLASSNINNLDSQCSISLSRERYGMNALFLIDRLFWKTRSQLEKNTIVPPWFVCFVLFCSVRFYWRVQCSAMQHCIIIAVFYCVVL